MFEWWRRDRGSGHERLGRPALRWNVEDDVHRYLGVGHGILRGAKMVGADKRHPPADQEGNGGNHRWFVNITEDMFAAGRVISTGRSEMWVASNVEQDRTQVHSGVLGPCQHRITTCQ